MITLTVTESEEQIIFGIPYYLNISSDSGAIYYTLDGSDPTSSSILAEDKIYLPTNALSFDIKIKAISEEDFSEVYSNSYNSSYASIKNTRKGNEAGVIVMTSASESANSMAFDSSGSETKSSSKDFNDLDIVASRIIDYDLRKDNPGKTSVDFINFSIKKYSDEDYFNQSIVNNNVEFDPKSKVIIINGRSEEEVDSQSVLLINRTYETFDPSSKFYVENESNFRQIISGNLVKSVYNSNTGILTSYYYESKESKWIVSNQKVEPKKLNISNHRVKNFVYKWVKDPVMSKIF